MPRRRRNNSSGVSGSFSSEFVSTSGTPPEEYYKKTRQEIANILNDTAANLESDLVAATPADTGNLRQGWTSRFANEQNLTAIVSQSKQYFLPLEMGRKPGKGISQQGQQSVKRWASRKLGLGDTEADSFAFLLSQKYKREGRPAEGFAGLAHPGDNPVSNTSDNIQPVSGGLIDDAFQNLKNKLNSI
jgi:hypothetical protein